MLSSKFVAFSLKRVLHVRRFFPRISRNELKTTIGKDNGKVRWNCYSLEVEEFVRVSGKEQLERMLNSPVSIAVEVIVSTSEKLKNICSTSATVDDDNLLTEHFMFQFNNTQSRNIYPVRILLGYHGLMKRTKKSLCFDLAVLQGMQRRKSDYLKGYTLRL